MAVHLQGRPRWRRRAAGPEIEPEPVAGTPTHCPYGALQCGMSLVAGAEGLTVAPRDFPTNAGGLCRKGWTAGELLRHPERLRAPLVRDSRSEPFAETAGSTSCERSWVADRDGIAARLDAEMARSIADYVEPWQAEAARPATANQFAAPIAVAP